MKHVRSRQLVPFAVAGALALVVALGPVYSRADAQSGPPAPPVPNGTPNPPSTTPLPAGNATPLASSAPIPSDTPSAAPGGRRRHRAEPAASASPEPSATPTSPAFSTLDGTWETQLQYIDRTDYSYLVVKQNDAGELSGFWRVSGKQYPLSGTYDGRLIRLEVKEPTMNLTWSGYVEGASDMVGLIDFGKGDSTPFTAEHRASQKSVFSKSAPSPGPTPFKTPTPKKP